MQLFAEYGSRRFEVASLEDASAKWCEFRDRTNAGASALGELRVVNATGALVARVSYNGRIWPVAPTELSA